MTRHIFALLLCALLASAFGASVRGVAADDGQTPAPRSIKDLPGYTPPADPESASVRIGRRMNAPLVKKPFKGGGASLKDLGAQLCNIFERTPKLDSLMQLAVSEDEFSEILWPEFPQSRPATGLTAQDGWKVLYPRLLNGCNSTLVDYAGGYWEFLRFDVDTMARYRNFTLHSGVTMVVRNSVDGNELRMNWLRAIAERKGRFKIYSVRD